MATSGRVILHLDLDCFYCQVEQKRLGIPREVPAAVQQWEGLIAINYAARALGITRHMRVQEAMRKCPDLQCIHVQTLGGESGQEGVAGPVNAGAVHPNDRSLQKACLERYRRASAEIIALIRQMIPQAKLEKASIDEVYVDVTPLVEKELQERDDGATSEHASIDAFAWGSIVEGGPLDTESEYDRRLSVGASIACRLRGVVYEKLDFTCSAGIAQNKLLAKVGSARNKPNQQTIVAARGITGLMQGLPLKKLRNFGGKLGVELQALGATTAGEVAQIPFKRLQEHFGDRAQWILNCVRGLQDEPVTVRDLSKSMLAAKSFEASSDMSSLVRWLGILADELADRMITDLQLNQRYPRLLVLSYRPKDCSAGRSRSVAMPKAPHPGPTAAMLKEAAAGVLQKCPDALPCCNLGLTATDFQDAPGDEQGCITRFFQPKPQLQGGQQKSPPVDAGFPGAKQEVQLKHSRKMHQQPHIIDAMFQKPPQQRGAEKAEQRRDQKLGSIGTGNLSESAHGPDSWHGADSGGASNAALEIRTNSKEVENSLGRDSGGAAAIPEQKKESSSSPSLEEGPDCPLRGKGDHQGLANGDGVCEGNGSARSRCGLAESNGGPHVEGADAVLTQSVAGSEGLEAVNLEEQKRIMHDIWVRRNMSSHSGEAKKRKASVKDAKPGAPKQPRLTDMFARKQK